MRPIKVGPVISGKEVLDATGGVFEVINPATGEVVAHEAKCDEALVARAVESSRNAFNAPAWRKMAPSARGNLLLELARLIERNAKKLVELELIDTGKPISQLRNAEIPLTNAIIRFYAGAADKIEGSVKSSGEGELLLQTWEPYGVVAGILPWNYPLVNAAMKAAPALAAGNAIVLKPSVETPLATIEFAKLCLAAGIPAGIVNCVTGSGSRAGNALVAHPHVGKVSFTGSTAVGRTIQKLAADQMKPVNLECGGKNAILVFADADLDRAAEAALISALVNNGQLCVSCSRILVQDKVAKKFAALLKSKVAKIKVGDPRREDTMVGPMITRAQYETALRYLENAPGEGCRLLCGGKRLAMKPALAKGFWIEPAILTDVKPGMKVHDEEVFGPVLSVVAFRDEEEAVAIANGVEYGLSGSVWTANGSRALRVSRAINTGILWVNTMLAGYPQIPVPPHKMSGTGVELGMEGLLAYCRRKSIVIGYDDNASVGWALS
jgi:acyl-CoA reductase-like NAD-dependent aldehyde dehydrogenase